MNGDSNRSINHNLQNPIKQELETLIFQSLQALKLPRPAQINLERPANIAHGDYATSTAMELFSQLKTSNETESYSSPHDLAEAIAAAINQQLDSQTNPAIVSVTVAGPGFINFKLSEAFIAAKIGELAQDPRPTKMAPESQQKIVVEYSSPNIAKPFTVGHLRSTIIGDAVANLLAAAGHTVYRDNHLGDWGTQFGKQIYAIKAWGDEEQIDQTENPLKELVNLYVKFHQEAEADPELEEAARAWFKKLEDGDPEARRLWQKCINWSWQEFEKIYRLLNVSFTENAGRGYGESFFEDKMDVVIAELKAKNLLQASEGAELVFFPNDELPPLMILKKDGSTLYATRDLAADKFRLERYGHDITVINETGSEQSLYFRQIFKTEELLGWYQPGQRVHIGHGMIRFKEGKMSTRKGNVVWLKDVLDEAYSRVNAISSQELSEETKWKIAVGALKWNDLKRSPHLNLVFDWDEIVNVKGNSGPYLQYTHVRCGSILAKAAAKWGTEVAIIESYITKQIDILLNLLIQQQITLSPIEKELLRNLSSYYETLEHSLIEYSPHHLANYLYELARTFNTFYSDHHVVNEAADTLADLAETTPAAHLRLLLTLTTARVIAAGLQILGIETVDKM